MGEGKSSGFGCSARKGKAPGLGKRFSRTSSGAGVQKVRIFISDDLPGLEEAIKKDLSRGRSAALCSARCAGCAQQSAEEGPGSAGRGSQEDLPGRDSGGGRGSLAELAGALGRDLSQDRGAVGDQGLCPSGVPASPQAHPKVSLYDEPAGTAGQGGEEAEQSSGGLLWGRSSGKALILGPEPSGRGMGSAQAAGICGTPDGELSC